MSVVQPVYLDASQVAEIRGLGFELAAAGDARGAVCQLVALLWENANDRLPDARAGVTPISRDAHRFDTPERTLVLLPGGAAA